MFIFLKRTNSNYFNSYIVNKDLTYPTFKGNAQQHLLYNKNFCIRHITYIFI